MRARALRVPRGDAESVRQKLRSAGLLADGLRVERDGPDVLLPLRPDAEPPDGLGLTIDHEFAAVRPRAPASYRDLLDLPTEEQRRLPRAFDVVGDIVLVRLPAQLEPRATQIGEALLAFVPGARVVGLDRGVQGPERRRSVERIAGAGGWATRHRENGIELSVDVEAAYFSPRLAREHLRFAVDVVDGMSVYDLCCGVGPFAVTVARDGRARSVTAVDANPQALTLLRTTLARAGLAGRVMPVEARVEEFLETAPPVERVVFNLPREGIKYAPSVGTAVAPGGRLTYFEVVGRGSAEDHAGSVIEALGGAGDWSLREFHPVHPYSPAADLVAYTFNRRPR
jgi:tRNA (guanine37-N1)-methyltransferase